MTCSLLGFESHPWSILLNRFWPRVADKAAPGSQTRKGSMDLKARFRDEEFLGLCDAAQCVTAGRDEAAANFRPDRFGKARRQQHILFDRPAHGEDSADLVDGGANNREIQAVFAAHIAIENVADMQRQIDGGGRQASRASFLIKLGGSFAHLRRRCKRGETCFLTLFIGENGECAVADEL